MKIIVTGGAGFIGSNLIRALLRHESYSIYNLDALTYAGNLNSLHDVAQNPRYRFEQIDICDNIGVTAAFKEFQPNWVIHLAAESHVDRSIDGPRAFVQTNVVGTFNLLQTALTHFNELDGAAKSDFRFLHVSTDEVYGSLGPEGFFSETTPYDPHSPYSATKAASDHLVRAWGDTYGLPTLVTNCSNNYGPFQFPEKLIPVVLLKALSGEAIPVYGKGNNIRDWLFVGDHADALHTVIKKGTIGETYNIGGSNERTNIDLVRLLCKFLDELKPRSDGKSYAEQISFVTDRPGHDLRYAIDASKIERELGWVPKQDHESGFKETVLWYLNNADWIKEVLNSKPCT